MTSPVPWTPPAPLQGNMRALFPSVAQLTRLSSVVSAKGTGTLSWDPVGTILDPVLGEGGKFACRLDLQFVRRGVDQPMPLVAGRAPDRTGILFMIPPPSTDGLPLILAGDRFTMVSGPVFGTFEMRVIPDVAQDMLGAHHIEVQVVEVSQMLQQGSLSPFPAPGTDMLKFEVNAERAIAELERLSEGPGTARFDALMTTYYGLVAGKVHILTGRLKASGSMVSSWDGGQWEGTISYIKYPGIFELARGNTPTKNHPEGGHHFFEPAYGSEKDYQATILQWLEGEG